MRKHPDVVVEDVVRVNKVPTEVKVYDKSKDITYIFIPDKNKYVKVVSRQSYTIPWHELHLKECQPSYHVLAVVKAILFGGHKENPAQLMLKL